MRRVLRTFIFWTPLDYSSWNANSANLAHSDKILAVAAPLLAFPFVDVKRVLVGGETHLANILALLLECPQNMVVQVGIFLDELQAETLEHLQQTVGYQTLAITADAGTVADRRNLEPFRDNL